MKDRFVFPEKLDFTPRPLAEQVTEAARKVHGSSLVSDIEQLVRLRHRLAATPGQTPAERRARARALVAARKACAGFLEAVEGARLVVSGRGVRTRDSAPGPRPKLARGPVPYGSKRMGGKLVPHEAERQVIERIVLWRAARDLSFAAIAARLAAEGVPSPGGVGEWSGAAVQRIIRREAPGLGLGAPTLRRLACRLGRSAVVSGQSERKGPNPNRNAVAQREGPTPA